MRHFVRFYSSKDVYGKVFGNMSVVEMSVVKNVCDAKKVEIKS